MSYQRVLPRDLFNEAKLLKCLGQLALLIHDGKAPEGLALELDESDSWEGFRIEQDQGDAGLYCTNLVLTMHGTRLHVQSRYNSQEPYPLDLIVSWEPYRVFHWDGKLHPEFLGFIERLESNRAFHSGEEMLE